MIHTNFGQLRSILSVYFFFPRFYTPQFELQSNHQVRLRSNQMDIHFIFVKEHAMKKFYFLFYSILFRSNVRLMWFYWNLVRYVALNTHGHNQREFLIRNRNRDIHFAFQKSNVPVISGIKKHHTNKSAKNWAVKKDEKKNGRESQSKHFD